MGSLCKAITLFSFLIASNTFADANWPNEPAGFKVFSDYGFDSIAGSGWNDTYNGYSTTSVNENSVPLSGPKVMQQRFPAGLEGGMGGGGGADFNIPVAYPGTTDVFWGFWMKIDSNYEQHPVLTKLGFAAGNITEGKWAGKYSNGFFLALVGPQGGPYRIIQHYQNDNIDNSHLGFSSVGSMYIESGVTFAPGQWVKIESYLKQSSCNTCRDGIARWWVNGQLAGNVTTLNTDRYYFTNINFVSIWGGMGSVKTRDSYFYVDHVRVSSSMGANIPIPQPAPAPVPAPAPAPSVGTVSDLGVVSSTSSSVNLSFTEVADGSGAPAKYDLRVGPPGSQWGSMNSIGSGNCATPIAGSQVGAKKTCTISGLLPSTQYQFQIVAYSGVMNQGASYGGLSSAVNATTQAGSPSPAPAPAPQPAPVPAPGPAPAPAPNPGNPSPGDSVAPQASFLYPTSGATLTGSVLFLGQGTDNVGVKELRFYINGVQLGSELKQAPYAMVVDTTKIQDGNHELSVVAKDAAGNMSAPSKIRINVLNSGSNVGSNPILGAAGCMQTQTNQVNASMGLIWALPLLGLMRKKRRGVVKGFNNRDSS